MDAVQAIVLGAVQGLTEFLPISSSGHLILIPWLLGWTQSGLSFDAALHLGTAFALLLYFGREWVALARGLARGLFESEGRRAPEWKLAWLIALGSVPAGAIGVLLESTIEEQLRTPIQVGALLIAFGLLLAVAERLGGQQRKIAEVGYLDALLIGLSQALALAPGVSRSGVTMTAGLLRGLTREASARFSFLLSTPITVLAGLYALRRGVPADEVVGFVLGVAASALVGLAAIWFLLRWLQRNSFVLFVVYRVLLGLFVLALVLR